MLSKITLFSIVALVARAERFQFSYKEAVPYVENQLGQRFMQVTQPECNPAGSLFVCDNVGTTVTDSAGNAAAITARLVCQFDPLVQVDFRQAQSCSCEAQVATADGGSKKCACTLCPAGYGDNPISIDCDMGGNSTTAPNMTDINATGVEETVDPFILDTCTSYDCDFRCNGTCKFGCDEVPLPEECYGLCGTPPPTGAPGTGTNSQPAPATGTGGQPAPATVPAPQPTSQASSMALSTVGFLVFGSLFMMTNMF